MKRHRLFFALSSTCCSMLVLSTSGLIIMKENSDSINHALHIETTKIVNKEEKTSSLYFPSGYNDGLLNDDNFLLLREDTLKQGIVEEQEGAVLLYNENQALPLKSEKKITLLGHASVDPVYKASSAGNYVYNDSLDVITLETALKNNGLEVNEMVLKALRNGSAKRSLKTIDNKLYINGYSAKGSEENQAFYQGLESSLTGYQDACIITLARTGAEGCDLLMDDSDDENGSSNPISSLALHKNEKDLLSFARNHFSKVIVLLNSPYPMEVEEIKNYADGILAIGQPGLTGFQGVADILTGKVNPSGRLVDTYATSSLSSPAVVNSGTRTPYYSNMDEINSLIPFNEKVALASFQAENIYIGYKYYETRYEDLMLHQYHADSIYGSLDGSSWSYSKEISYPFGYGLSYTTFKESLRNVNVFDDQIEVEVEVTNTGDVKGKHIVQVYLQTPYGEYEKNHGVEKSAVTLVGFAKTEELDPEESTSLTIPIDPYFMASYDANYAKTYIISEGTNYLSIGSSAHDALNNILARKHVSTLYDEEGDIVTGDINNVFTFETLFDDNKYAFTKNNKPVTNRFDDCDINNLSEEKYTYLSRSDWENTYPKEQTKIKANSKMLEILDGEFYVKPESDNQLSDYILNQEKNIKLIDMKGVDIDDKLWDEFLSQFSFEDLAKTTAEGFTCPAIDKVSQPLVKTGDGMDSLGLAYTLASGKQIPTMTYACKNILTSTWNKDLYARRGQLMGEESLFVKSFENFCIGPNLHRTPFGGRNFEYMSEDSNLSYLASIPEIQAMENKGVHAAPKHFAGNDQETCREGVSVFFNEQAFRENDLRAFEGALKVAGSGGVMQSFERVGLVYASASKSLNRDLLREEWSYKGNIVTDATYGATTGYKGHVREIIDAGSEQFCLDGTIKAGSKLIEIIKEEEDTNLLECLLDVARHWEYQIVNSNAMNGIDSSTKIIHIIPWWDILLRIVCYIFAGGTVIFFTLGMVTYIKNQQKDR